MINGNPGSTVCKKRMGFDFIVGYRTTVIWQNGLEKLEVACWSWMIWWKKGNRINACWIYPPKIPIIATLPCCICYKIYFLLENSPRWLIAMHITSWPSKTLVIKRACGPFYFNPFPTDGVKSWSYLNASHRVPLDIWCCMFILPWMITTNCGVI